MMLFPGFDWNYRLGCVSILVAFIIENTDFLTGLFYKDATRIY
jgi:hypothetical protein